MLNDLLGGGTMTWVLVGFAVFFLLRGGTGGSAVDSILDLLRGLLNRPKPKSAPNFNDAHDCVGCVVDLSRHLEKKGHAAAAKTLRDLIPELVKDKHDHE